MLPLDQFWGTESCSDASDLQSLWDAEMLASLIIQLSTSTFHIFMNEERYWMLGCCDWLQRTHSTTRPPNTHTHRERARRRHATLPQCIKGIRLPLTHAGEIERASGEGSLFILIFSLAAPGAQWCNTGDLFVTDHPRFLLAADWLSGRMNEPLCSLWGGGLGGVKQKHVTCSLREKKEVEKKLCWLPWQQLWIELKWVCMLISLFVTHVGSVCIKVTVSVCFTLRVCCWIYIINCYCMIAHYRQWECNSYCFIIIAL